MYHYQTYSRKRLVRRINDKRKSAVSHTLELKNNRKVAISTLWEDSLKMRLMMINEKHKHSSGCCLSVRLYRIYVNNYSLCIRWLWELFINVTSESAGSFFQQSHQQSGNEKQRDSSKQICSMSTLT